MGKYKVIETGIDGLIVIENEPFFDSRGYFFEAYNENDFAKMGITKKFVQDNQSKSTKAVLRGLHFQINYPQAKLVRCIKGKVYDVAVDIRKGSPTFGKHFGIILDSEKHNMFYIPENFAHGFLVLSDEAEFLYKVTDFYHPNDEGGIIYNDKDLNINWPIEKDMDLILSDKDKQHKSFKEYIENN